MAERERESVGCRHETSACLERHFSHLASGNKNLKRAQICLSIAAGKIQPVLRRVVFSYFSENGIIRRLSRMFYSVFCTSSKSTGNVNNFVWLILNISLATAAPRNSIFSCACARSHNNAWYDYMRF